METDKQVVYAIKENTSIKRTGLGGDKRTIKTNSNTSRRARAATVSPNRWFGIAKTTNFSAF